MKLQEQLFCALTDVGDDLVEEAGRLSFPVSPLRRMLPLAACCALLLGAALALESWKPIQEADIILPGVEDTVQEVVPPVEEDAEAPSHRPYYIMNLDDNLYGAVQAVDPDGNVLVEVEQGVIYDLVDEKTGEILAICAQDGLVVDDPRDTPTYVYDLQGNLLTTVDAWSISCYGDVIEVYLGESEYQYYSRSDLTPIDYDPDAMLPAGFHRAGNVKYQYGADGLCAVADDTGKMGLIDESGAWVLQPDCDDIAVIALGLAAVYRNGQYEVVSLETGDIVFTWPYPIIWIHADGYVVEREDGLWQAVNQEGLAVSDPADIIYLVDDENDGQVEFLAEVHLEEEWACFCRPDGTAVRTVQFQGGEMRILSSRTVAVYVWQGEASSWLVDLESGEEIHWIDHDYLDPQRISDYEEAVILSATYEDDDGTYHTDILSETGEVLIADVNDARGVNHLGDGVFVAYRDGKRVLARVDGTILYKSDAPA